MISRSTAKRIATLFALSFRRYGSSQVAGRYVGYHESDANEIYDFLYENGFPAYLCNAARTAAPTYKTTRKVEDFIMQLHTGESLVPATKDWSWPEREQLGQEHLRSLAEDLIEHWRERKRGSGETEVIEPALAQLKAGLELDGF